MFYENMKEKSLRRQHVFRLTAPGSSLELLVIFIGRNSQNLKMDLLVEHLSPQTSANIAFKAVLSGNSKVEFTGNLRVPGIAQKSDTFLKCDTLLLSPGAQSKTVPSLEIVANDVKAGHAASSGKPEEEALFYLMSRGLSLSSAQKLLVESFLTNSLKVFTVV